MKRLKAAIAGLKLTSDVSNKPVLIFNADDTLRKLYADKKAAGELERHLAGAPAGLAAQPRRVLWAVQRLQRPSGVS